MKAAQLGISWVTSIQSADAHSGPAPGSGVAKVDPVPLLCLDDITSLDH